MFEWYQHISKNMVLSLKLSQATVHLSFCQKIRLLCQHQAMSRRNTVTVSEVLWLFFRAPRSDLKMRTISELSKAVLSTEDPFLTYCCLKESPSMPFLLEQWPYSTAQLLLDSFGRCQWCRSGAYLPRTSPLCHCWRLSFSSKLLVSASPRSTSVMYLLVNALCVAGTTCTFWFEPV